MTLTKKNNDRLYMCISFKRMNLVFSSSPSSTPSVQEIHSNVCTVLYSNVHDNMHVDVPHF